MAKVDRSGHSNVLHITILLLLLLLLVLSRDLSHVGHVLGPVVVEVKGHEFLLFRSTDANNALLARWTQNLRTFQLLYPVVDWQRGLLQSRLPDRGVLLDPQPGINHRIVSCLLPSYRSLTGLIQKIGAT